MHCVSIIEYYKRHSSVNDHFETARKTIGCFADTPEAIDSYVLREKIRFKKRWESFPEMPEEIAKLINSEGLSFDHIKVALPDKLTNIENRLNQNELILLIALFESFMKDMHRAILVDSPRLLRAERSIPLGKLVSQGIDSVVAEEIEKEVQSYDRKSLRELSFHFREKLSIDKFAAEWADNLQKYIEMRNTILHENPDLTVSQGDCETASAILFVCPMQIYECASQKYPKQFVPVKKFTEWFTSLTNRVGTT